jgi:DNA-binding XRE family transcriptional regulator
MLMDVYGVLHEADPSKAVDVFDQIMARKEETSLAYYRKMKGLSQSQLAKASGVSVRSIQLFEQRKSNINNAQYNHLSSIANVLGCQVDDLIE